MTSATTADTTTGDHDGGETAGDEQAGSPRPQSLLLSFLGLHVLGRDVAVYSGSVIDVLARVGVSEEAVRATLARMVRRDLLARHRRGRKMYFGLTGRSGAVLRDGHDRIWSTGVVNREWDGTWTLVGFSLPEAWRRQRHDLRTRLMWAGFGPLQNGLWIAPGHVDVPRVVAELGLDGHLNVMRAHAAEPTEAAQLVRRAFDTAGIAARYRAFLDRWDHPDPAPAVPDDFTRQLLLHNDWLQLVRTDPHLPAEHLPADWPAIRAEHVFRTLSDRYDTTSREQAGSTLDTIPTPET
ncbi:PaaX family transcriptional regulator C-terminal domain-containing protein [Planobispora longispora]|uniref:PaaX family transcriptional regulator n=1 Tax=Planobispora longispora TaxID=28887 RepID=A0A8J3RTZ5_9ACTN|nr:PaaX family transcriptional regulator C-terminal domain-containing protein [Planobispora longispora]GIH81113.1 PaaX family transcriptional regulator [Planobispora longispora]